MEVHVVQKGDTLWKISRQYGISFEELKRVNAHLANPDYVVPGMKIFLPNQAQKNQGPSKQPNAPVEKVEKVEKFPVIEKKPVEVPSLPKEEKKEEPKQEQAPVPLPKPPTITTKPIEKEKIEKPKEKKPPVEKPKAEQPKVPQATEKVPEQPKQPEHPIPPMIPVQPYPIYGIPCAWMPIYDADCHPHYHHPGHMQQPQIQPARPPAPTRPMTQLPVEKPLYDQPYENYEEVKKEPPASGDQPKLPKPSLPQINDQPLSVPQIPMPKIEDTEPLPQPVERPVPPTAPAPPVPQQNWSQLQPGNYPNHAGEVNCYDHHQFIPVPPNPHGQLHPFCNQCQQPIGQHGQQPMYVPMPNYWRNPY